MKRNPSQQHVRAGSSDLCYCNAVLVRAVQMSIRLRLRPLRLCIVSDWLRQRDTLLQKALTPP